VESNNTSIYTSISTFNLHPLFQLGLFHWRSIVSSLCVSETGPYNKKKDWKAGWRKKDLWVGCRITCKTITKFKKFFLPILTNNPDKQQRQTDRERQKISWTQVNESGMFFTSLNQLKYEYKKVFWIRRIRRRKEVDHLN